MKKLHFLKRVRRSGSFDQATSQKEKKIMHNDNKSQVPTLLNEGRLRTISLIVVLNLIVWCLIPIQLIVFYGEELKLDILSFSKMSAVVFVLFTSFLILFYLFLYFIIKVFIFKKSRLKFQNIVNGILIFVICWVTLSGYVFPLIKTIGGMVDDINIPTNWINLIIVLAISGLISYLYSIIKARKIIAIVFITFYLSTLPTGIIHITHLFSIRNDDNENLRHASQLSSNKNLLVISFDGLPGQIVNDIFTNEHEIQSEFKDFLHFSNAISTAPVTFASTTTELFGNINMRNFSDNEKDIIGKLPLNNLLMNMYFGKGVSVTTFGGHTNKFNINRGLKLNNIAPPLEKRDRNIGENFSLYGWELSRLLTGKIAGYIYPRITVRIIKLLVIGGPFQNHKGASWDKPYLSDDREYRTLIDNMHICKDTLVIKYFHFLHTHYPVDFDKNGQYRSYDETWHKSNQNYIGLYNQTYYALSQFVDLIKKLKELKVYDNTFLVLKSDHGEPTTYFSSYPYNLTINEHNLWGYSRYCPLLMIKDLGRKESSMVDIPNLVTLGDLANTIASRFQQLAYNSGIYPGLNLLERLDASRSPYIYLNIVRNAKSSFQYDSHITIKIDRRTSNSLLDLLKVNDSVRLSNDSIRLSSNSMNIYKIGKPVFFSEGGESDAYIIYGWSFQEPTHRWTDGSSASLLFHLEKRPKRDLVLHLWGYGFSENVKKWFQKIKVTVNGKQIANWEMRGNTKYDAPIPAYLVPDGIIKVAFEISNPTKPSNDNRQLGMFVSKLVIEEK